MPLRGGFIVGGKEYHSVGEKKEEDRPSDVIRLKAMVDSTLMTESADATTVVVIIAYMGISQRDGTCICEHRNRTTEGKKAEEQMEIESTEVELLTTEKKRLKGTPWPLTKASSWRGAVAMLVIPPNVARITMIEAMTVAPVVERIELWKTLMKG
jgi:hypothetical protein